MKTLIDVLIGLVLVVAIGPALLGAIAAMSGVILPVGFVCIVLWAMFGPKRGDDDGQG